MATLPDNDWGFIGKFSGFWDWPNRNFTTAVDEGKMRRHPDLSGTPVSRAVWIKF